MPCVRICGDFGRSETPAYFAFDRKDYDRFLALLGAGFFAQVWKTGEAWPEGAEKKVFGWEHGIPFGYLDSVPCYMDNTGDLDHSYLVVRNIQPENLCQAENGGWMFRG